MRNYFKAIVEEWRNRYMNSLKDNKEYGAITEQGDLGLGFDILNEQDQETMRKNDDKENKDNK